MILIYNLPKYAMKHKWLVCRVVDGAPWFYGAYDDQNKAFEVATAVDGIVVLSSLAMPIVA